MSTEVFSFINNYGFPVVVLVAVGYLIWAKVIPYIAQQLNKQQEFLFSEIKRLQEESKEDKRVMIDLVKQGNENTAKLQTTLEKINTRLDTLHKDISDVYRIVAINKKLIDNEKEMGGR